MLSRKAKYALKAALHLAARHGEGPVQTSEIAREERIPQKFLEQILLEMRKSGLLASRMGRGGGYSLRKAPDEVTFGMVVRLFDGPLAPIPCVSETAYMACRECRDEASCGVRAVMKRVRDATAAILDRTTFADALAAAGGAAAGGRRGSDAGTEILRAVGRVRDGSVEVVVRDSAVVRIESRETVDLTGEG